MRRRAEENSIAQWNDTLSSGRADSLIRASQGMMTSSPLPIPAPMESSTGTATSTAPSINSAAVQAELERRRRQQP